jgi:hypothetical protein
VATFDELRQQAEQEIRGQGRSLSSDDFVGEAADLLAALRLWAAAQGRTEDDVREVVQVASGTMLKNIAPSCEKAAVMMQWKPADDLMASLMHLQSA